MGKKTKYRSPKLLAYGFVRNLTGGSITILTNDSGGNMGGTVMGNM